MPHPGERIWMPLPLTPWPEILKDTESKPGGITLTQYSVQPVEWLLLAAFSEVYSEDYGGESRTGNTENTQFGQAERECERSGSHH